MTVGEKTEILSRYTQFKKHCLDENLLGDVKPVDFHATLMGIID